MWGPWLVSCWVSRLMSLPLLRCSESDAQEKVISPHLYPEHVKLNEEETFLLFAVLRGSGKTAFPVLWESLGLLFAEAQLGQERLDCLQ